MLAQAPAVRKRLILAACGLALEAWAITALVQAPGSDIPRHVALAVAASAVWIAALGISLSLPGRGWRRDLALIFAVAVAMRVTLLFTTPSLSDDAYRAVWDARLVHAGVNPYEYAPAATETQQYRDDTIWPRVNHKDQRTPYPPLATVLSAAAYRVFPEQLVAMQALAAAADLASAALLAWLLARIGSDPRRCLAIAWSPIGALHFAHSGHNDAIMIATLLAAPLLLTYGRRKAGFVALGLATATKGVPALTVPAFIRAGGWVSVLFWAATCAIVTLPFLGAGLGLAAGVLLEAGGQRFNDSAYLLVERAARLVLPGQGSTVAMLFAAIALGTAVILSYIRADGSARGALVASCWVLGVYVLVAPVVEPWYFTWMAPLIALELKLSRSGLAVGAWLWLSGMATLTDLTYLPGGTALWVPIRAIEYVPAYALLALGLIGWLRRRQRERPEPEEAPAVQSFADKRG